MLEVTSIAISLGLLLALLIFRTIYRAYVNPLRDVPGPWLARFTRLWLAVANSSRRYNEINRELHQKYGPIVRIAPNEYSIDDPDAAQIIFRSRDQLPKVRYSNLLYGCCTSCGIVLWYRDVVLHDLGSLSQIPHEALLMLDSHPSIKPLIYPTQKPASSAHKMTSTILGGVAKFFHYTRSGL